MNAVMPLLDYVSLCDGIREKTGETGVIKSGELKEKIDSVYALGVSQGILERGFWDLFQNYGMRSFYGDGFRGSAFEYIRPAYKVVPTESGSAVRTFNNCKKLKKVEAEYFDFSKVAKSTSNSVGFYNTFTACSALEEIEDVGLEGQRYFTSTFNWCGSLKKIARIGVSEDTVFNGTFNNCASLEDVTFDGVLATDGLDLSASPRLNRKSLESILSCLKDFSRELVEEQTLGNGGVEVIGEGELIEGNTYNWSFYCSQFPGWLVNSSTEAPVNEKNVITSVAGKVTVDGKEYVGFTAVSPAWAEENWAGTYSYTVYGDNGSIMIKRSVVGENDIISVSAVNSSEEHTVKLGEANLLKLTEAEIASAEAKGWSLE